MGARMVEHPLPLAIVVLAVIVLFGWKRLPDMSRSVARSLRVFKDEVSDGDGVVKARPRDAGDAGERGVEGARPDRA